MVLMFLAIPLLMSYGIKVPLPRPSAISQVRDSHMAISGLVMLFLGLFWFRTLLKLFGSFERGLLFTAQTVRCVQILGGIHILFWLKDLLFAYLIHTTGIALYTAGLGNVFSGFLVIFVGWVMDEARKIRDEQDLTV
ncbi:MAG: hypothetical protein JWM68_2832 [Verrucomicrobiales bacterium]|nr:hypothetical protein [Verrucomicrobiales bacterium]